MNARSKVIRFTIWSAYAHTMEGLQQQQTHDRTGHIDWLVRVQKRDYKSAITHRSGGHSRLLRLVENVRICTTTLTAHQYTKFPANQCCPTAPTKTTGHFLFPNSDLLLNFNFFASLQTWIPSKRRWWRWNWRRRMHWRSESILLVQFDLASHMLQWTLKCPT